MRSLEFGACSKAIPAVVMLVILTAASVFAGQDQQIQQKLIALEKTQGAFSFIVIGDNRSGDDIYKKIVSMIMERKPAFIVNTGDMIATPGDVTEWIKFWDMSKPITAPYFLAVGNHDAHPKFPLSEKTYKHEVDLPGNELYYSFLAGNSLFVVLDSYLDDQEQRITGEQYQWLESVLKSSKQKHKFVFLHHPLYTEPGKGKHSGGGLDSHPKDRDRLETLFVKAKIDAVFAGHEHYYQRKIVDGIVHIITGGAGAPLYAKDEGGGFNHFIRMTVDGDKVGGEVVDISGRMRDQFTIISSKNDVVGLFRESLDFYAAGRYVEALQKIDKVIEVEPCNASAWINKTVILNQVKRYSEGLQAAQRALECNPNDDIKVKLLAWNNKTDALNGLGRYSEALITVETILSIENTVTESDALDSDIGGGMTVRHVLAAAWGNKGVAFKGLGRLDDAVLAEAKAIELQPDLAEAWYNRACYYSLLGNKKNAIENLRKAIALNTALKKYAMQDSDFREIREDKDFQKVTE